MKFQLVSAVLPRYRCHKCVSAAKIHSITPLIAEGFEIHLIDGDVDIKFHIPNEWVKKHSPEPGGYFVIYDDDYT